MKLFRKKASDRSSMSAVREDEQGKTECRQYFQEAVAAGEVGDHKREQELFEKAARQGHLKAQYICGMMYVNGIGTAADEAKALLWLEKAADQGHVGAQFRCGEIYYHRRRRMETVHPARHGKDETCSSLVPYPRRFDAETRANLARALYWYEKAAGQGHVDAQFQCGEMYNKGEGTEVDTSKALMWYEKAAEQGHIDAQYQCGFMYYIGRGTAVDRKKFEAWLEKAAPFGRKGAENPFS